MFALVPFAWGARAAVHAGRGEALAFLGWAGASTLALAAAIGVSVALAQRLYRGELDLGDAAGGGGGPRPDAAARASWAPSWRRTCASPGATRARRRSSSPGSIGPLVLLLVLWQGSAGPLRPGLLLAIASFSGLGALGANAFALERQGLGLLLGFPADRLAILVGKNLGVIALRLPALLAVSLATARGRRARLRPRRRGRRAAHPGARVGGRQLPLDPLPVPGGRGRAGPGRARLGHAGPGRRGDDARSPRS